MYSFMPEIITSVMRSAEREKVERGNVASFQRLTEVIVEEPLAEELQQESKEHLSNLQEEFRHYFHEIDATENVQQQPAAILSDALWTIFLMTYKRNSWSSSTTPKPKRSSRNNNSSAALNAVPKCFLLSSRPANSPWRFLLLSHWLTSVKVVSQLSWSSNQRPETGWMPKQTCDAPWATQTALLICLYQKSKYILLIKMHD